MFVFDPRKHCCEGYLSVGPVGLNVVYKSFHALESVSATAMLQVVSAKVRDVAWGSIYEVPDVVSRGAALKPNVWCMLSRREVILNVLEVTVTN